MLYNLHNGFLHPLCYLTLSNLTLSKILGTAHGRSSILLIRKLRQDTFPNICMCKEGGWAYFNASRLYNTFFSSTFFYWSSQRPWHVGRAGNIIPVWQIGKHGLWSTANKSWVGPQGPWVGSVSRCHWCLVPCCQQASPCCTVSFSFKRQLWTWLATVKF